MSQGGRNKNYDNDNRQGGGNNNRNSLGGGGNGGNGGNVYDMMNQGKITIQFKMLNIPVYGTNWTLINVFYKCFNRLDR